MDGYKKTSFLDCLTWEKNKIRSRYVFVIIIFFKKKTHSLSLSLLCLLL